METNDSCQKNSLDAGTKGSVKSKSPENEKNDVQTESRNELKSTVKKEEEEEMNTSNHLKRLSLILRYIASMHHSSESGKDSLSFVKTRRYCKDATKLLTNEFFNKSKQSSHRLQTDTVLFSTSDFRDPSEILNVDGKQDFLLFATPPFSFYKASSQSRKSKSSIFSAAPKAKTSRIGTDGRTCWLRLTRLGSLSSSKTNFSSSPPNKPPKVTSRAIRDYLFHWMNHEMQNTQISVTKSSVQEFVTLERIDFAPKAPRNMSSKDRSDIKVFIKKYKKFLKIKAVRSSLEPIYNRLFEWLQQQGGGGYDGSTGGSSNECDEELIWGFGNARMIRTDSDSNNHIVVNGPLLEVMVEVELSHDGALLIRPRAHTGVSLNREVVSAITNTYSIESANDSSSQSSEVLLSNLYRSASQMETSQLAPGEPSTYMKILKRMAVELSSGGIFQSSSTFSNQRVYKNSNSLGDDDEHQINGINKLIVTDAWCLYSRAKPRTVWAKDASTLGEQILSLSHQRLPHKNSKDICSADGLPKASWVLTHGPGALDALEKAKSKKERFTGSPLQFYESGLQILNSFKTSIYGKSPTSKLVQYDPKRPLFPLPTSEAQNRIAHLLLTNNYPAIVCEGPPGTGKTHTIANILCAFLCKGKRVLITSKGAPALSVLRQRLPESVQELCVDVSTSETTGMRQLQQTVERLANRVSRVSSEMELEKRQLLQRSLCEFENELKEIDSKLEDYSERKRKIFRSPEGQQLADFALDLIENAGWLMRTFSTWTLAETKTFTDKASLFVVDQNDLIRDVQGISSSPCLQLDMFISHIAAKAGETVSAIKTASSQGIASIPLLGTFSGFSQREKTINEELKMITIKNRSPVSQEDWKIILRAAKHNRAIKSFHQEILERLIIQDKWPIAEVYECYENDRPSQFMKKSFLTSLNKLIQLKETAWSLNVAEEISFSKQSSLLDSRRSEIAAKVQYLAEELVESTVVTELSRMFSAEAQSALIRFAQVAGKSRFSKSSSVVTKLSQRQRRHRQEYLDAFEKCVRYIPCWILTTSQISDYLPPELGLFDLVVIDEASQSDITALPSMLRGKQWLIVGDGKQVSPTESFVSESQISSLRAALPESPLEDSLLPGHSFFDLCSQAFPRGRVVLKEHFRCAPEIIQFSNLQFYDSQLVPLRLPTSAERMTPSIMDIKVKNGLKSGKVNVEECDAIVTMVEKIVEESNHLRPRSIGIISFLGYEQSRLIRGRLLNAVGPQKYKEHNILVGEPPTFQGAERDIIFITLVCSPGSVPTQNQLMHAQRANVALSRARDRMILVRSIDCSHIPNNEDIKIPILEFFDEANHTKERKENFNENFSKDTMLSFRTHLEALVEVKLQSKGYAVRRMGIVWSDAIVVENEESGSRAAVCLVCSGESKQEWASILAQQKSIERVGWNCFRVDALSMIMDFTGTFQSIEKFLTSANVEPMIPLMHEEHDMKNSAQLEHLNVDDDISAEVHNESDAGDDDDDAEYDVDDDSSSAMVVISDDDYMDNGYQPSSNQSHVGTEIDSDSDVCMPEEFGEVADLAFLVKSRKNKSKDTSPQSGVLSGVEHDSASKHNSKKTSPTLQNKANSMGHHLKRRGSQNQEKFSSSDENTLGSKKKRRKNRLEKRSHDKKVHSRKNRINMNELENDYYDMESEYYDGVENVDNVLKEEKK